MFNCKKYETYQQFHMLHKFSLRYDELIHPIRFNTTHYSYKKKKLENIL